MTAVVDTPPAARIAISVWSLMIGVFLIMIGNGVQWILLSVRLLDEGYSSTVTGTVTAGYFVGMLAASLLVPSLLARVGHVRVFAALASLASTAILVQSVFVDPVVWTFMRLGSGFSFAGLYIVCESWLNEESTPSTRAQLLSIYMIIQTFGMALGQISVNLSDPAKFDLFILVSVVISLSLVPMALSKIKQPALPQTDRLKIRELYKISPFGTLGAFGAGMGMATVVGMSPVYGRLAGMTVSEIAWLGFAFVMGPVILQWPFGRLSDLVDRRIILITACLVAGGMALVCNFFLPATGPIALVGAMIVGGASVCLYSLFLAYLTDFVDRSEIVALCGIFVAVCGAGSIFSPMIAGYTMDLLGPSGFWWLVAIIHLALAAFGLYRTTQRDSLPSEEQAPFTMVASRTLPLASEWSEEVYDFTPDVSDDDLENEEVAPTNAAQ